MKSILTLTAALILMFSFNSCEKEEITKKDDIAGKWMKTTGCSNAIGDKNYYKFYSDGSGFFFAADCNSQCTGMGIKFYFKYKIVSNSSIEIDNTSVSDYCGITSKTPVDNTLTYSKTSTTMTINGSTYKKQ